eukprot:CAMPEP_0196678772 /NCGR_PEP_ID=MMETSP1090-20130531/6565_1 /TAXON_ID=37098 /ORGANISM="Isochrysis sp, Strain CCMP1244" /LENGTH=63 /DNA_ID=CAMNT_0042016939 /DNA_START=217 /DNA_END=406 /DNA_ORIENTATION=-
MLPCNRAAPAGSTGSFSSSGVTVDAGPEADVVPRMSVGFEPPQPILAGDSLRARQAGPQSGDT